jgi:hypothetical protein
MPVARSLEETSAVLERNPSTFESSPQPTLGGNALTSPRTESWPYGQQAPLIAAFLACSLRA